MEEKSYLEKLKEWQNSPEESSKKSLLLLASIILVALVILGINSLFQETVRIVTTDDKETLEERRVYIPEAVFNAAGNVIEAGDQYLVIESFIFDLSQESGRPIKVKRKIKVNITESTKITRLEFVLSMESGKREPEESEISFRDINLGDYISVLSTKNIKNLGEFEAASLRLME